MKLLLEQQDIEGHGTCQQSKKDIEAESFLGLSLKGGIEEEGQNQDKAEMDRIAVDSRHHPDGVHPDVEDGGGDPYDVDDQLPFLGELPEGSGDLSPVLQILDFSPLVLFH